MNRPSLWRRRRTRRRRRMRRRRRRMRWRRRSLGGIVSVKSRAFPAALAPLLCFDMSFCSSPPLIVNWSGNHSVQPAVAAKVVVVVVVVVVPVVLAVVVVVVVVLVLVLVLVMMVMVVVVVVVAVVCAAGDDYEEDIHPASSMVPTHPRPLHLDHPPTRSRPSSTSKPRSQQLPPRATACGRWVQVAINLPCMNLFLSSL
jgi:hypothetical protein